MNIEQLPIDALRPYPGTRAHIAASRVAMIAEQHQAIRLLQPDSGR